MILYILKNVDLTDSNSKLIPLLVDNFLEAITRY